MIALSWILWGATAACSIGASTGSDASTPGGDDFALSGQSCPAGEVVAGITSTGFVQCIPLPTATATTCDEGQYMVGLDEAGAALCAPVPIDLESMRDYVNTNCFIYLGWRDECDGCMDMPIKTARTHGAATECATSGENGGCQPFTVFGESVRMASLNTDGDVNDDDKFWVGLKCK